jgi:hypothetical protein
MSEVFVGSEALRRGALTRSRLRWNYNAIYPDVYVRNDVVPSLRQQIGGRGILTRDELISDDELVMIDGMAVSTPSRTAFDLARHLNRDLAVRHLDALARRPASKRPTCSCWRTAIAAHVAGVAAAWRWT